MDTAELKRLISSQMTEENEDVDKLKRCINDLGLSNLDSSFYRYLLLESLKKHWTESFDYLVSLKEQCESTILLDTIPVTLPEHDYYALKLLKKGADVHCYDSDCNSLLHYAIARQCPHIAQTLIENGLDANVQNIGGDTPLHSLIITSYPFAKRRFCAMVSCVGNHLLYDKDVITNHTNLMDLLEILLLNGADPLIRNNKGHTALDLAIMIHASKKLTEQQMEMIYNMIETLLYYMYDDVIPCHIILEIIHLPIAEDVLDQVREITMDYSCLEMNTKWSLFSMDVEFLKKMIHRFDHVVMELLEINIDNFYSNSICIENFEILLRSSLVSHVIEFIKKIRFIYLIEIYYNKMYQKRAISEAVVFDLIFYLLTYGLEVYQDDLESVYDNFGRCELFNILLHMDVGKICYRQDIWLSLLYDFQEEHLTKFLNNPRKYTWKNVSQLLFYYSDHRLKDFFREHYYNNKPLMEHLERLPQVPPLLELARNAIRIFFIEKLCVQSSYQFYSSLKCLPIGTIHKKIIALEQKLYF